MSRIVRALVAFAPLALTPLLLWLLGNGGLSFGGGEKDMLLVFPWMLWSICFAIVFLVKSRTMKGYVRPIVRGLGWATGLLILLWLVLFLATVVLPGW